MTFGEHPQRAIPETFDLPEPSTPSIGGFLNYHLERRHEVIDINLGRGALRKVEVKWNGGGFGWDAQSLQKSALLNVQRADLH